MTLPLDPSLALGTVHALAESQGRVEDPLTDEQPGRILHERRFGWSSAGVDTSGEHRYYGTADATRKMARASAPVNEGWAPSLIR